MADNKQLSEQIIDTASYYWPNFIPAISGLAAGTIMSSYAQPIKWITAISFVSYVMSDFFIGMTAGYFFNAYSNIHSRSVVSNGNSIQMKSNLSPEIIKESKDLMETINNWIDIYLTSLYGKLDYHLALSKTGNKLKETKEINELYLKKMLVPFMISADLENTKKSFQELLTMQSTSLLPPGAKLKILYHLRNICEHFEKQHENALKLIENGKSTADIAPTLEEYKKYFQEECSKNAEKAYQFELENPSIVAQFLGANTHTGDYHDL